ncbi:hypothetical protein [Nocardioides houyundeii]|uniref:hypothetical protein n=1 Tax=Nocardioides houyundeii TaxID=2045452 RepID=UPI000C78994F|nr:hypothetical protein [Nocardioides houyundeii]
MDEIRRTSSGQRAGVGWVPVTRGVHRRTTADPFPADLRAWACVLPGSARFTHLTAARLHGLWLPPLPDGLPVLVAESPDESRPQRPGLRVLRPSTLAPPCSWRDLPVDPPAETILAASRDLAELDVLVLVDSALHRGAASLDQLRAVASARRRGAPLLRRVLDRADDRSESPWETLLRALHTTLDVEVEPQHVIHDADGTFVARGDLRLRGTRTLHEYDGGDHLAPDQQRRDLRRARHLERAGWVRRGYTADDVLHRAITVLRDADASLGRRHDPGRVRAWHALLRESCFAPSGRARLSVRLAPRQLGT